MFAQVEQATQSLKTGLTSTQFGKASDKPVETARQRFGNHGPEELFESRLRSSISTSNSLAKSGGQLKRTAPRRTGVSQRKPSVLEDFLLFGSQ